MGGCLEAGTKIRLSDGTLKNVEDFEIGDEVKTNQGNKKVINTWNPETLEEGEPECYEIEFEDGHKVVCSSSHKFLIGEYWVEAENLKVSDDVAVLK